MSVRISRSKVVKIVYTTLMVSCAQSNASEPTYYGSVGLHQADFELGSIEETDSASFNAHIGWSANDYVAIEIGYQDFGDFTVSGNGSIKAEADAFQISLIGAIPVSQALSIYAEIGIDNWTGKILVNSVPGFGTFTINGDGTDVFYGIGSTLKITKNLNGFFEYLAHDLDSLKIDTVGIGIKYYVPGLF